MFGRSVVTGMLLASLVVFWGCRQVWRSLGASSEAVVIDIRDIQPGTPAPDRHIDLENFLPLPGSSFQRGSKFFIPLVPIPEQGIPADSFTLNALVYDTRLFARMDSDDLEHLIEGKGLIMGTAEMEFDRELRNRLRKELRIDNLNSIEVVEFGRGPSLLWGLALIVGGFLGMAGVGFMAVKAQRD